MMTGGRIVGHAAQFLPIASTRLLIVGYQGEDTLGRELQQGARQAQIDGRPVSVRAEVHHIQTMSSHADQGQLIAWLKHMQGVKKVFLTHGDNGPRGIFAKKISDELGIADVATPSMQQTLTL